MNTDHNITDSQWHDLVNAVETHVSEATINKDRIYTYEDNKRTGIYDNYDYCYSPGLILESGKLFAWSNSELNKAPISFSTGLNIAQNFFNEKGSEIAEEIVCNYVMDNNQ
jgi:hypothetical protein